MRVIYVAGWLRSGTTLLSRMLGAGPGVVALGEVSGLWRGLAMQEHCSCGELIIECPVWSHGLKAVETHHGLGVNDFGDFAELTRSVLRTRRSRSLAALSAASPGSWPNDVRSYVEVVGTLLRSIAEFTGAEALVDSSKLPPGFLTLRLVDDAVVDVVQIVRDPRAVANSEVRSAGLADSAGDSLPPGRSALLSSVYWSLGNLAVLRYGGRAHTFSSLRYEELAAHPYVAISALTRRLGLPEPRPGEDLLASGHLAVGNPTRFDGSSRPILPDVRWKKELSVGKRVLVTSVSSPARALMRRALDHPAAVAR